MEFYIGNNVQTASLVMQPCAAEDILTRIRTDVQLQETIAQMRRVKSIDHSAYVRLKARLPFFCCGEFSGGIRRGEFFIQAPAIVLDVDGCAQSVEELLAWRKKLSADPRVWCLFTSPGGDGLKLVFQLASPCTGVKTFSDFYKSFAYEFAARYQLNDYIDHRTSDCTRVCFLSYDPQVYVAANPQAIDWNAYVLPLLPPPTPPPPQEDMLNESHAIRPDVYREILRKLETKSRPRPQKFPYVPELLQKLLPDIGAALAEQDLVLKEARDIQYGKKLLLTHGLETAEINVFYGKRGFSVVKVVKRTANESLADLAVFVIEQVLYQRPDYPFGEEG